MLENYEFEEVKATKEEQFNEALRRMEVLNLNKAFIEDFKKGALKIQHKIHFTPEDFIIFVRDLDEREQKLVEEVENEYGIKVFATLHSETNFGDLLDCIYVTQYKEEWEMDDELMEDDVVMTYCINKTIPEFSEFGSIGIEKVNGQLHRVQ